MTAGTSRLHPDSTLPWATIREMLATQMAAHSERLALVDGECELSYEALADEVAAVARNMAAQGISAGDNVVIWSHNCWQWVVSTLACWSIGATIVPLSSRLKALEVIPVLQATACKLLVTSSNCGRENLPLALTTHLREHNTSYAQALPALTAIAIYEDQRLGEIPLAILDWPALTQPSDQTINRAATSPGDLCEIMFTSGSTGKPKGVMLAHQQTLQIMWDAKTCWTINEQDTILIIAPLSHVTGINAGLLAGLMSGATLVLLDIFNPKKALALIAQHQVSCLAGPPALFKQLLVENKRGSNAMNFLRKVSILGAPVPQSLIGELKKDTSIQAIFTGYGMTECSSIATTRADDSIDTVATTVGHPMPGLEVKIDKSQEQESGEILVKGYGIMQGYYQDVEQTQATLSNEGWLRTGDIGKLTDDGRIQLLGRKKEMYISYGFNVFPAEVEFLLLQTERIEAVAVVARPNKFTGEEGVAFVVPKQGDNIQVHDIIQWSKQNMANYKVPGKVILCERLPLNANGKIDKLGLASQLTQ